jgi:hypothetical protein
LIAHDSTAFSEALTREESLSITGGAWNLYKPKLLDWRDDGSCLLEPTAGCERELSSQAGTHTLSTALYGSRDIAGPSVRPLPGRGSSPHRLHDAEHALPFAVGLRLARKPYTRGERV